MAFEREKTVLPLSIGDISIAIFDPDPVGPGVQSAIVFVQIRMDDGQIRNRQDNLADHVSAATITQLKTLAATLRTKAIAEILTATP